MASLKSPRWKGKELSEMCFSSKIDREWGIFAWKSTSAFLKPTTSIYWSRSTICGSVTNDERVFSRMVSLCVCISYTTDTHIRVCSYRTDFKNILMLVGMKIKLWNYHFHSLLWFNALSIHSDAPIKYGFNISCYYYNCNHLTIQCFLKMHARRKSNR